MTFSFLEHLPLSTLAAIVVIILVAIVMIGLCWSLWRDMRTDPLVLRENAMPKELRDNFEGDGEARRRRGIRIGRK